MSQQDSTRSVNETDEGLLGKCLLTTYLRQSSNKELMRTNISICIINTSLATFAVLANLLYIRTYMITVRLQTVSNMLLVNLAMTDFLVGSVVQPLYIARKALELLEMPVCSLWDTHKVLFLYLSSASVLTLLLISCDRYIATSKPLRYKAVCPRKRMKIGMGLVWLLAGIHLSFLSIGILLFYVPTCAILILSVGSLVFMHCRMLHQAKSQRTKIARDNTPTGEETSGLRMDHRKPEKTVACIVGCLILCVLPSAGYVIYSNIAGYTYRSRYLISPWTETMLYLNSSINPIIYCWRNRTYRKAAHECLHRRNGRIRKNENNVGLEMSQTSVPSN